MATHPTSINFTASAAFTYIVAFNSNSFVAFNFNSFNSTFVGVAGNSLVNFLAFGAGVGFLSCIEVGVADFVGINVAMVKHYIELNAFAVMETDIYFGEFRANSTNFTLFIATATSVIVD